MGTVVSVFGVEPFRIGGTETFARELSSQLGQRGWKSVLCFLNEPPEQVRRFLTLPNVSLEVVADVADLSWHGTRGIASVLRRYRPQILHLHFTGFLGLYPWLAHLSGVEKTFFTDHTSRPAGYVPHIAPAWKRLAARAINRPLTRVICVSKYGKQCLDTLNLLPSARHELIYNAVDLSRVNQGSGKAEKLRERYGIPKDRTLVVQVSWIIPEKGIAELLQVARQVVSANASVQFVLVGEGDYREQYMKDAVELGVGDNVTWTGLVQDPFGEGVYDAADIVCQLSHWEEVFGWMIAEAMAFRRPVVATKVGGIPELIEDSRSGFLVCRGDIAATAERILYLAERPELRREMGEAGREIAARKFSLERNVAQLLKSYGV